MVLTLDKNVLLDHIEEREPFYNASSLVCLMGITMEAKICAPVSIMTDLFYTMRKVFGSKDAQSRIENGLSFIEWIPVTPEDASEALSRRWADFEDCMLFQCAKKIHADYIITRDENGFKESSIEAISPEKFLEQLKSTGIEYDFIDF